MRYRLYLFLLTSFIAGILITIMVISPFTFFLMEVGPLKLPYIIISSAFLIPLQATGLHWLSRKVSKYHYVLFIYYVAIILLTFISIHLFNINNKYVSSIIYFLLAYSSVYIIYLTNWILIEKSLNIIDFKNYTPVLLGSEQLGTAIAGLGIIFFFSKNSPEFFMVVIVALSLLMIIILMLLSQKQSDIIFEKEDYSPDVTFQEFKTIFQRKGIILSIFLISCFLLIFEQSIFYELGLILKTEFKDQDKINVVLSFIRVISGFLSTFLNYVLIPWILRYVNVGSIFIIYGSIMFLAFLSLLLLNDGNIIVFAAICRSVSQHSFYRIGYEQTLSTLTLHKREKLKTIIEALITPTLTLLFGWIFFFLPNIESLVYVNFILTFVALYLIYISFGFDRAFIQYHGQSFHSENLEERTNSIQALGSTNKVKKNKVITHLLLEMLNDPKDEYTHVYLIKALGEIKEPLTENALFQEMQNNNELIQKTAIEALKEFRSFSVQEFLLSLLEEKYQHLNPKIRLTICKTLYKQMGVALVPILLPSLKSKDLMAISNTIEILSIVEDKQVADIIKPFLSHENSRIKGNAIMALYKFRRYRKRCVILVEEMFLSNVSNFVKTAIYVIGRLQLHQFELGLTIMSTTTEERVNPVLGYSLSLLENEGGYEIFSNLFNQFIYEEKKSIDMGRVLLYFSEIPQNIRLRVIDNFIGAGGDPLDLANVLQNSPFNLLQEIQYLKQIWLASMKCVTESVS